MPTDTTPTQQEINDWNDYLKYFNQRVKEDGISDDELDKGDGRYSAEQYAKFHMAKGKNYNYPSMTQKMQAHYNALYNSPDQRISEGIKKYYPKPELSPVDGRIGSYTKNSNDAAEIASVEISPNELTGVRKAEDGGRLIYEYKPNKINVTSNTSPRFRCVLRFEKSYFV